jgi:nicotinamidase-related amidase
VDIQEGFAPHIHGWESLLGRSETIVEAARRLGLPMTATEQNPAKLGSTVDRISSRIPEVPVYPKMTFSSLRVPEVWNRVAAATPVNLVLLGIETHVCILQTALEALSMSGVTPYLLVDAISSRRELDRDTALRRLQRSGAVLTTVESVIFEILGEAGTDGFRAVLPLVK